MKGKEIAGFYILTEEEFDKRVKQEKREALLHRLSEASTPRKRTKKESSEPVQEKEPVIKPIKKSFDTPYGEYSKTSPNITESFGWDDFMDKVDDSYDLSGNNLSPGGGAYSLNSPIDAAAGENIYEFGRVWEDEDRYDTMFKDEIAMASEILKDLKTQGKMATDKLKSMGGRGAGGITKTYADLLSATTSIHSAKLAAIDKIAGWKLKREELRLKAKKDTPEVEESVDSLVDNYYAKYIVGNRGNDRNPSPASDNRPEPNPQSQQSAYDDYDTQQVQTQPRSFNLTDPDFSTQSMPDDYEGNPDPYGYIRNEGKDIEICIEKLPSGALSFVAIDSNGEYVDDYEVPGKQMLDSIQLSPLSNYATDKAGRKYRVIDFETQLDIEDDDEY